MVTGLPAGRSAVPGGRPDKHALIDRHGSITFGELGRRVGHLAQQLTERGLAPGQRVAAMVGNSAAFFEVGLGAARAGCPVVPVNWHLTAREVAWMLVDSGARLLVTEEEFGPVAAEAVALVAAGDTGPGDPAVPSGAGPGGNDLLVLPPAATRQRDAAVSTADPGGSDPEGWRAPQYLYFTSGTTGRPRAVERETATDQQQVLASLASLWGIRGDDVYLACSPLYHATNAYAYATLFQGGTVVVLERWDAREWLRLVERHRVTACFLVPAHFVRLLEVPDEERRRYDTSSLRLLLHAAAPCPVPVKRRILEALPSTEIWEFYGATEGGATRISRQEWLAHPGSVGRPWPGTEVLILDEGGNPLGPGRDGLIYIRPPETGRFRYRNDPQKTEQAWQDNAFTVGDVGHLDADGYLYITDRAADMVLRGGVNVYPAEAEAVLHQQPAVVDCAVIGVPDERMGEELLALVELRAPVEPRVLVDHCRRHLAAFKCPGRVEVVDQIPRDATGKVRKRLLAERWARSSSNREENTTP